MLEISAGPNRKSATLRIDIDGKDKRLVVNPNPFLSVTRLPGDADLAWRCQRARLEQRQQPNYSEGFLT